MVKLLASKVAILSAISVTSEQRTETRSLGRRFSRPTHAVRCSGGGGASETERSGLAVESTRNHDFTQSLWRVCVCAFVYMKCDSRNPIRTQYQSETTSDASDRRENIAAHIGATRNFEQGPRKVRSTAP